MFNFYSCLGIVYMVIDKIFVFFICKNVSDIILKCGEGVGREKC